MLRAIEILVQEHRVINAVLDCLEQFVERSESELRLDPVPAQGMVTFFKEFADACHHGKEEDILFVLANQKTGDPGAVALLQEEHREGRGYIGQMQHAIESPEQTRSLPDFCANARDFMDMLRRHIQREDYGVFPMIEDHLSNTEGQALLRDFQAVELKSGGRWIKLTGVARELCRKYNVPFPENQIGELIG